MGFIIFVAIILGVIIYWLLQNWLIILCVIGGIILISIIAEAVKQSNKPQQPQYEYAYTAPLTGSCSCDTAPSEQPTFTSKEPQYIKKIWSTPNENVIEQKAELPGGDRMEYAQECTDIMQALESVGVMLDLVNCTMTPSSISYHFNLFNLAQHKKVQQNVKMIDMILEGERKALIEDSNLAHFCITVPRHDREFVNLKTAMLLKDKNGVNQFEALRSPTTVALGIGKEPVILDISKAPHLLIAGTTGSGKSIMLHSIIASMLFNSTPASLAFLMVDPKRVELSRYNGLPFMLRDVVTDKREAIKALKAMCEVMDDRYEQMSKGVVFKSKIVVIIDELADLLLGTKGEQGMGSAEEYLIRLCQLGRACGMHVVSCTQNPLASVVTSLIRANMPTRIGLKVASHVESRVIGVKGCEGLSGKGDAILSTADSATNIRFQASYISDSDIEKLIQYWKSDKPLAKSVLAA